jgi:hypothetical protein
MVKPITGIIMLFAVLALHVTDRRVSPDLIFLFTIAEGVHFGEPGYLNQPQSAVTDSKGNIYISDHADRQVHQYSPEGAYLKSYGGAGRGPGEFNRMAEIAVDEKDRLMVLDRFQFKVSRFDTESGSIEEHQFEDMSQINMTTLVPIGEDYFAGIYMETGRHIEMTPEMHAVRLYKFGSGVKERSMFEIFTYQFDPEIELQRRLGSGLGHKLTRYSDSELVAGHMVYTGRHFIIDTETGSVKTLENKQLSPPHYHLMDWDSRPAEIDDYYAGAVTASGQTGRHYYQMLHQTMVLGVADGKLIHIYRKNEIEGHGYNDYLELFSEDGDLIYHDKLPDSLAIDENVRYRSYLHLDERGRLFVRDNFEMEDPRISVYQLVTQ